MSGRSLGHRAPLLWLALPLIAGLVLGRVLDAQRTGVWLCAAAGCGAAALMCARRSAYIVLPLIGAAMLSAGTASYALQRQRLTEWESLPPREISATVRVTRVFASSLPHRCAFIARITAAPDAWPELAGQRIYVSTTLRGREVAPLRTAEVRVSGVLAPIAHDAKPNSFDGYLASAGVNFRLSRARLLGTAREPSRYQSFCDAALQLLSHLLGRGVEAKRPELVRVYRAMLLGQQAELTEEQTALFRESGTMHVFSISGLHIAAIAVGLHAVFALLRIPRFVEYPIALGALWLYVDITGAAPSAVRAFVMVALFETAILVRLPRNPLATLTASALVIAVCAPLQVFSASFQMSYGIVAALLLLGLPLDETWQARLAVFRQLPKATWRWYHRAIDFVWRPIVAAGALGTSALLIGLVTGIAFFGLFTPGSFLVNLWLIPASTLVVFFGFVALLCGLVGFSTGCILGNHAAVVVLGVIQNGVRLSVGVPGMWVTANFRADWVGPTALCVMLATMFAGYQRSWNGWARGFWPPFAVGALVLIAATQYG